MAIQANRSRIAGFLYFEAVLSASEVLVIPLHRSASRSGDSSLCVQAAAGTALAGTLQHMDSLHDMIPENQRYVSTVTGDYPGTAGAGDGARWGAPDMVAADWNIVKIERTYSALKITAPAGGTHVIVYGDY